MCDIIQFPEHREKEDGCGVPIIEVQVMSYVPIANDDVKGACVATVTSDFSEYKDHLKKDTPDEMVLEKLKVVTSLCHSLLDLYKEFLIFQLYTHGRVNEETSGVSAKTLHEIKRYLLQLEDLS